MAELENKLMSEITRPERILIYLVPGRMVFFYYLFFLFFFILVLYLNIALFNNLKNANDKCHNFGMLRLRYVKVEQIGDGGLWLMW